MTNRGTMTAILCFCPIMLTVAADVGRLGARVPFVATPSAASTPATCPVTLPNGSTPPEERPNALQHGDDGLWTELWPAGIVLVTPDDVQPDGSLAMKFPWWRGPNVHGQLAVTGRRLDTAAAPLRARVPEGYGDTGFQSTALFFPSDGCWEVGGRAGGASLTFVTLVVRSPVLAIPAPVATPAA